MAKIILDTAKLSALAREAVANAVQEQGNPADKIFTGGIEAFENELKNGRSFAVIMHLRAGVDYEAGAGSESKPLKPEALKDTAARVFKMLSIFDPTIDGWSEITGGQKEPSEVFGFNIVAHWNPNVRQRLHELNNEKIESILEAAVDSIESSIAVSAERIIEQVGPKTQVELKRGKLFASIMTLKDGVDYVRPKGAKGGKKSFSIEWLSPLARTVFDACADAALKPTVEYWFTSSFDMRGEESVDSGFEIIIHFDHL